MSQNITKEGIEVKVGQVWRDLDKRMQRTVTVERVANGFAYVLSSSGSRSRISLMRMHKHATGFSLIEETK